MAAATVDPGNGGLNINPVGPTKVVDAAGTNELAVNVDGSINVVTTGGGGAVTIADGADVAEGTTTDPAYTTGSGTVVAILKGIFGRLVRGQTTKSASLSVAIASDQVGTAGSAATDVLSVQGIASGTNLNVAVNAALPAGTNLIGKFGIDQTTPGTTNAVSVTNANILTVRKFYTQTHNFTTTGANTAIDVSAIPATLFSLQVNSVTSGANATAYTVHLEGSLDNTNWSDILLFTLSGSLTDGTTISTASAAPYLYIRARCSALTLGADATAITCNILAVQ